MPIDMITGLDLTSRVMVVSLNISVFTGSKVDKTISQQVADNHGTVASQTGHYKKQFVGKQALESIQKIASVARTDHYKRTLPYNDNGMRMLSTAGFVDYTDAQRSFKNQFLAEVQNFALVYPDVIDEARARLKTAFDTDDYPPIDELLSRFKMDYNIEPLPSSLNWFLKGLNDDAMDAAKSALDNNVQAAVQEGLKNAFERVATVTGNMVDRLNAYGVDPDTGKATGVFRDSLVENARELLELLPSLNITENTDLASITEDLKDIVRHDAKALRIDDGFRRETAKRAAAIHSKCMGFF